MSILSPNATCTLSFDQQQVQLIFLALQELPEKARAQLANHINAQLLAQMRAVQERRAADAKGQPGIDEKSRQHMAGREARRDGLQRDATAGKAAVANREASFRREQAAAKPASPSGPKRKS